LRLGPNSPCADSADGDAALSADILYLGRVDIKDVNNTGTGDPNYVDMGAYEAVMVHNTTKDLYYWTIQQALDDANDFDVIEAYPYTYYETIDFNDKPVHLRSTDPNDPNIVAATIIDANDTSPGSYVVTFNTGEDANSILDGITITGGYYGIYCYNSSSPTITNCRIVDNGWYGIYADYFCSPEITKSTISGNGNCGLYCNDYGSPTVSRCRIINNGSYGIYFKDLSGTLTNCIIAKNSSWGVYVNCSYDPTIITNCTIFGNSTYGIRSQHDDVHEVKNCIMWDNGNNLYNATATYSCIEDGDSGLGNFSINPRFVDTDANDFHLLNWSRCIDWGDPNSDYSNEPNGGGGRINVGAYGNTEEAATLTDNDGDDLPDGWQEYYWPGYDANDPNYGPGGNPDADDFNNMVEYLFGYDPNQVTDANMELIVGLSASRFDPTESETLTIIYLLNMDANVAMSSISFDTNEVVWTSEETVSAGQNEEIWYGKDSNSLIVEGGFYDIAIDANDGDGNTANYGPEMVEVYYVHDINNLVCNPYRIIPMNNEVSTITYDLSTDANMVVTVYDPLRCAVCNTHR